MVLLDAVVIGKVAPVVAELGDEDVVEGILLVVLPPKVVEGEFVVVGEVVTGRVVADEEVVGDTPLPEVVPAG